MSWLDVQCYTQMARRQLLESVAVLLTLLTLVNSYGSYRNRIPNGHNVVDPCQGPSVIWIGVGHYNQSGGGNRNSFGLDFHTNGKVWNKALCEKDSDSDGRTNGEELGDANCTWVENDTSSTVSATHPGICEPINSTDCLSHNTWLYCSPSFVPITTATPTVPQTTSAGTANVHVHTVTHFVIFAIFTSRLNVFLSKIGRTFR
jgi:dopamine beta-monooxygenase